MIYRCRKPVIVYDFRSTSCFKEISRFKMNAESPQNVHPSYCTHCPLGSTCAFRIPNGGDWNIRIVRASFLPPSHPSNDTLGSEREISIGELTGREKLGAKVKSLCTQAEGRLRRRRNSLNHSRLT